MEVTPKIFNAKVMHKRVDKRINYFCYKVFYTLLPVDQLTGASSIAGLAINRPAFINFRNADHGQRDGSCLQTWIDAILRDYQLKDRVKQVMLLTMPRVAGYVFNPVSFWFCLDYRQKIIAVLCEVNNTFGQTHSYFCLLDDEENSCLTANKSFFVSPFFDRTGYYQFRFHEQAEHLSIEIDYFDQEHKLRLTTRLFGKLVILNSANLVKVFFSNPFITFRTTFLIHWQGLKLLLKGVRYITKPPQLPTCITRAFNIKKK